MKTRLALVIALYALLAGPIAAQQMSAVVRPVPQDSTGIVDQNILTAAASAGQYRTFLKAVDAAGLTETLQEPGPYTVFAPTDAAFAALPPKELDALLAPANHDRLTMVLLHHISPQERTAADVRGKPGTIVAMDGKMITIDGRVDGARITQGDLKTGNGVLHGVDRVLGMSQVT